MHCNDISKFECDSNGPAPSSLRLVLDWAWRGSPCSCATQDPDELWRAALENDFASSTSEDDAEGNLDVGYCEVCRAPVVFTCCFLFLLFSALGFRIGLSG